MAQDGFNFVISGGHKLRNIPFATLFGSVGEDGPEGIALGESVPSVLELFEINRKPPNRIRILLLPHDLAESNSFRSRGEEVDQFRHVKGFVGEGEGAVVDDFARGAVESGHRGAAEA